MSSVSFAVVGSVLLGLCYLVYSIVVYVSVSVRFRRFIIVDFGSTLVMVVRVTVIAIEAKVIMGSCN